MWIGDWVCLGIGIYKVPGAPGEDLEMGGGEDESAWEIATLCECGPEDVWKIWCPSDRVGTAWR